MQGNPEEIEEGRGACVGSTCPRVHMRRHIVLSDIEDRAPERPGKKKERSRIGESHVVALFMQKGKGRQHWERKEKEVSGRKRIFAVP